MSKGLRIVVTSAVLAAGVLLVGPSAASAQAAFEGTFPLPHGRLSVSVGDPFFRVGAPVPYDCDVYSRPGYGYGFFQRSYWYPVRRFERRWYFAADPIFVPVPAYRRIHGYRYRGSSFFHGDRFFRGHRFFRDGRHRPFFRDGRHHRFFRDGRDHRFFRDGGHRRFFRHDRFFDGRGHRGFHRSY